MVCLLVYLGVGFVTLMSFKSTHVMNLTGSYDKILAIVYYKAQDPGRMFIAIRKVLQFRKLFSKTKWAQQFRCKNVRNTQETFGGNVALKSKKKLLPAPDLSFPQEKYLYRQLSL